MLGFSLPLPGVRQPARGAEPHQAPPADAAVVQGGGHRVLRHVLAPGAERGRLQGQPAAACVSRQMCLFLSICIALDPAAPPAAICFTQVPVYEIEPLEKITDSYLDQVRVVSWLGWHCAALQMCCTACSPQLGLPAGSAHHPPAARPAAAAHSSLPPASIPPVCSTCGTRATSGTCSPTGSSLVTASRRRCWSTSGARWVAGQGGADQVRLSASSGRWGCGLDGCRFSCLQFCWLPASRSKQSHAFPCLSSAGHQQPDRRVGHRQRRVRGHDAGAQCIKAGAGCV